jgi:hypothetical protein
MEQIWSFLSDRYELESNVSVLMRSEFTRLTLMWLSIGNCTKSEAGLCQIYGRAVMNL